MPLPLSGKYFSFLEPLHLIFTETATFLAFAQATGYAHQVSNFRYTIKFPCRFVNIIYWLRDICQSLNTHVLSRNCKFIQYSELKKKCQNELLLIDGSIIPFRHGVAIYPKMGDHKLFLYPLSRSYVHQNVTPIAGIHFFYLTAAVPNYRELRTPVYLWRTEYQFELQKYYGLDVFSLLIKELIKLHVPYFCALQKHVICWSRSTKKFFLCCSYIST